MLLSDRIGLPTPLVTAGGWHRPADIVPPSSIAASEVWFATTDEPDESIWEGRFGRYS